MELVPTWRQRFANYLPMALAAGVASTATLAGAAALLYAPREVTMGDTQRIVYLHVAVAWCGLVCCLAMGVCGALYLWRGDDRWDQWSRASAEVGWLCMTLTLLTGSLWARAAWNTWWTWEPRLTASLVLWLIYAGYFVLRAGIEAADRQARVASVLAVLALADLPLIILATRWFRGMHPVAPEMDARMRIALLACVAAASCAALCVTALRRRQLACEARIARREFQLEESSAWAR